MRTVLGKSYVFESTTVADGDYYSPALSEEYARHYIYIEFFSDDSLSPTSLITKDNLTGTVTYSGTPRQNDISAGVGEEYLSMNAGGTLTLGTADYTPASGTGLMKRVKVNLNTIAGAGVTAFRVTVACFN